MKTIYLKKRLEEVPESVATIGVFDGVHLGHQLVIGKVLELARQRGLASTVITFDRQPRQVLDPSFRPQLLTTLEEKQEVIASLGISQLVVLPFTREMASLSAWDFMQQVLSEQLHVKVLFTGYDNRFGHDRTEGFDDYVRYGEQLGMQVLRGDVELMDGGSLAVSSSVIRKLLAEEGRVDLMPRYLTRRYALKGRVMPGEHIGHRLGYPTANLEPEDAGKLIPAAGVYAVWAMLEGEQTPRAAMMNIGMRPTFDGHRQTLEVNILHFDGNLYGQMVQVTFVERLRDERKFDSPEALTAQLEQDCVRVNELLGVYNK
ncbi:MAG: riboflavin biosynthesis protein RibF [Prevotella sp.]|nr:riboflavin biosynthesis protein RibF [Prevotella sp.]